MFSRSFILLSGLLLLYSGFTTAEPVVVPTIIAKAYILQDFQSGTILLEKNIKERIEPASLTKLMTAYLIFQELKAGRVHLNDMVKISQKAWRMGGSRMYLEVETSVELELLLKGMIIQSGNDASVALAEFVAGSEESFVNLMNQRAKTLGLTGTHYMNVTGMPDEQHYTTTYDLAQMARTLITDFPDYYSRWYSEKEFTYNNITQTNRNTLLWDDKTVDGMKTGFTKTAGYCLIASAKRGNMRLISIVMGAENEKIRSVETQKMLDYGFRYFETYQLYEANFPLNTEKVWQGDQNKLKLGLSSPLYVTIPKGQYSQLKAILHLNKQIVAPVEVGSPQGTLKIYLGDRILTEQPLIALSAVAVGNFFQRLLDSILLKFQ